MNGSMSDWHSSMNWKESKMENKERTIWRFKWLSLNDKKNKLLKEVAAIEQVMREIEEDAFNEEQTLDKDKQVWYNNIIKR